MAIKEFFLSWGMIVLSVLFNAYGVFVVKLRLNELGEIKLDSLKSFFAYLFLMLKSKLVLGGIILFFIAPFLFVIALSRMEVSVAYPVQVVLNFLFLLLLAVIFLGEGITLTKAVGIALALASIFFLYK